MTAGVVDDEAGHFDEGETRVECLALLRGSDVHARFTGDPLVSSSFVERAQMGCIMGTVVAHRMVARSSRDTA